MPSEQESRAAAANRFVATLGAAMAAANYPVTMVRATMAATSRAYGPDNQFLALPNYVQVESSSDPSDFLSGSTMSIAIGVQTGLLLWRAAIQLTPAPDRRAVHD